MCTSGALSISAPLCRHPLCLVPECSITPKGDFGAVSPYPSVSPVSGNHEATFCLCGFSHNGLIRYVSSWVRRLSLRVMFSRLIHAVVSGRASPLAETDRYCAGWTDRSRGVHSPSDGLWGVSCWERCSRAHLCTRSGVDTGRPLSWAHPLERNLRVGWQRWV